MQEFLRKFPRASVSKDFVPGETTHVVMGVGQSIDLQPFYTCHLLKEWKFSNCNYFYIYTYSYELLLNVVYFIIDPLICERTLKYFLGIVHSTWVVSSHWLRDSIQHSEIQPEVLSSLVTINSFFTPFFTPFYLNDLTILNCCYCYI